jgi:hypothetical protein
MTIAPQLERELIEAVRRHHAGAPAASSRTTPKGRTSASRRARAMRPPVLAAAILALALVGVAAAATELLGSGAPIRLPPGAPVSPRSGYGLPRAGGVRLLDIAAQDPAGGPPWGARYVETTRDVGCLQIGRLVRGQLGVIGIDGAFGDDGLFHALPADYLQGPFPCATLDAHGDAFAAVVIDGMPASGSAGTGGCRAPDTHSRTGEGGAEPACSAKDERLVMAGLAGPLAESVTYEQDGTLHSVATAGPDGAYLIVTPMPHSRSRREEGGFSPVIDGVGAGSIVKITYRGGKVRPCKPAGPAHERICRPFGETAAAPLKLDEAAVRAPVSTRLERGPGAERTLTVSFRARAAITNAHAEYWVHTSAIPGPAGKCGYSTFGPLDHDVAAGELVQHTIRISDRCHGRFTVTVTYRQNAGDEALGLGGSTAHPGGTLVVGRSTVSLR